MASVKQAFGTTGQSLTITLTSLADAAGRESTYVDNGTNLYLDALVMAVIKTQNSGTISDPKAVYVYAYGTSDTGTPTYPDAVTGSDAAITPNDPSNLKLLGTIGVAAINTTYKGGPWSVASLFGGKLPERWGVVVYNDCGTALSATGSDHYVKYQGVYATVA
jgi:hypothetical protein